MDTKIGIAQMPGHEDSDELWRAWAQSYPTVRALAMTCAEITASTALFVVDEVPFPLNANGAVNGGVVSLMADQIMGVLAARTAPTGSVPATAALNVQYHVPAHLPLEFRATAIPGGRVVQSVEIAISDREGRRCCTAIGTMAIGSARKRQMEVS